MRTKPVKSLFSHATHSLLSGFPGRARVRSSLNYGKECDSRDITRFDPTAQQPTQYGIHQSSRVLKKKLLENPHNGTVRGSGSPGPSEISKSFLTRLKILKILNVAAVTAGTGDVLHVRTVHTMGTPTEEPLRTHFSV